MLPDKNRRRCAWGVGVVPYPRAESEVAKAFAASFEKGEITPYIPMIG